jgi:DNA polymerase IV (DinB-like DNA polymerase)
MEKIILHVDLDSFYASLEEIRNEEIQGKPVVICVYSGRTKNSGAVSTSNYKARELGIKAGMPISRAQNLAKDKDVIFLPNDMEYYSEVSGRIMELLEEEADTIEQVSIDEACLDVTENSERELENAVRIAKSIKKKIEKTENITCSVGIGSNKLVAKMASEYEKPDGLTVIKDSEIKDFFEKMSLKKLHGIGPKTIKILEELGIKTTKELANANLSALEGYFGPKKALKLQNIARGIGSDKVEPRQKKQISRIGTLKEDSDDVDFIFDKMKELLKELNKKSRKKRVSFHTISIITIDTSLKTQTRSETIPETRDVEEISDKFRDLLENFLEENKGIKLRRVGVRISNLTYKKEQTSLKDFKKLQG